MNVIEQTKELLQAGGVQLTDAAYERLAGYHAMLLK